MFSLPGHVLFWIVALVIFLVVEAVSVGLVSIWFAVGALAALICAALHGPVWLQAIWFVVVSGVTLILTRPLVRKYVTAKSVATNADRNIGRSAVVTEQIDNLRETGAIKLDGLTWTARSETGDPIPPDTPVTVVRIEGVKAFVTPKETN